MPDMMDYILANAKKADPQSVLDYPETVIQTLRLFYDVWKIPEGAIPSKKQKSNYARWINELTELNTICPSSGKMRLALMRALKLYEETEKKVPVSRPSDIKQYLVSVVADMKRADEDNKNRILSTDTESEKKDFSNKLKNLLED